MPDQAQNDNTPPRLVKLFDRAATPLNEIALAVIDVQEDFCDPRRARGTQETLDISNRIADTVPDFRAAGIDLYVFYFGFTGSGYNPFKFVPDLSRDKLLEKSHDSAFASRIGQYTPDGFKNTYFKRILDTGKKSVLLTCGFNLSACVEETVLSARHYNYDVILLSDLCGNGQGGTAQMAEKTYNTIRDKGAHITTSRAVLDAIYKSHPDHDIAGTTPVRPAQRPLRRFCG